MLEVSGQETLIAICTRGLRDFSALRMTISKQMIDIEPCPISLLIVFNGLDGDPEAKSIAEDLKRLPIPSFIEFERNPGVAWARNRAVQFARRRWSTLIFLDDDEQVSDRWLVELLKCSRKYPKAIVAGPVRPVFKQALPPEWANGFTPWKRDEFPDGHSLKNAVGNGNLLLPSNFLSSDMLYNSALNDGGEDTDLTLRWLKSGLEIRYAADAVGFETVVEERLKIEYVFELAKKQAENWTRISINLGQGKLRVLMPLAKKLLKITLTIFGFRLADRACSLTQDQLRYLWKQFLGHISGLRLGKP